MISGFTTDGKPVVPFIGPLVTSRGVPLEFALLYLQERGMVTDWVAYLANCLKDGHKPQTIRSRVLAAMGDVHGAAYLTGFTPRLDAALASLA